MFFTVILLNSSLDKKQWTIDNRHKIVGFLPVLRDEDILEEKGSREVDDTLVYVFTPSTPMPLQRGLHATGDLEQRENG